MLYHLKYAGGSKMEAIIIRVDERWREGFYTIFLNYIFYGLNIIISYYLLYILYTIKKKVEEVEAIFQILKF